MTGHNGGGVGGGLDEALAHVPPDQEGFDWDAAARELASYVVKRRRLPWGTPGAWHGFDAAYYHHQQHRYYAEGPSMEELMAWMWTPETATAFGILMLALAVFLCCWVSHKIGEALCSVVAGFLALMLLAIVLAIFLSQWM